MAQPPVQTIFNVSDGLYGLRYLKIVKSPSGPHFIVDVMFTMGLRLTADIIPGQPSKNIGDELDKKLRVHRSSEYDKIKPAVQFVAECSERVLSDESGNIVERQLHPDTLREAWEMTLFRRYLKVIDPKRLMQYEVVLKDLDTLYSNDGVAVLDHI